MNIIEFNIDSIYFAGDIHGNFNSIGYHIKQYDIHNSLIVFCGDVGIGFYKLEYYKQVFNRLKKILSKYNVYIVFVRGNHDDKSFFDNKTIYSKRIKAVSDYTILRVYKTEDKEHYMSPYNILCIGGAISIDRTERKELYYELIKKYTGYVSLIFAEQKVKKIYWEDEAPVYLDNEFNEIKEKEINIDAVATHTCPSFCHPITKDRIKYWLSRDKELENDINNERQIMDMIYQRLQQDKHNLDMWCYGHYHHHNNDRINNIKFYLLDKERNGIIDMIELRNF